MVKNFDSEYFVKNEIVKDEVTGNVSYTKVRIKKDLRWRVYFGYSATDFITIGEEDLEKVKYAWLTKGVYKAKLSGSEIKRIEEDWRYYANWSDGYDPKYPEDFAKIKSETPYHLIEERERIADARVRYIVQSEKPELLQSVEKIDQFLPEAERPLFLENKKSEIKNLTAGLADKFKV